MLSQWFGHGGGEAGTPPIAPVSSTLMQGSAYQPRGALRVASLSDRLLEGTGRNGIPTVRHNPRCGEQGAEDQELSRYRSA